MERLKLPPIKANVIKIKDELSLAKDGRGLLEQKKDILINNINLLASKADQIRSEVDKKLEDAYKKLSLALLEAGEAAVEAAGLGVRAGEQVVIKERSLMGVVLPIVHVRIPKLRPEYSFAGTTETMDQVRKAIHSTLEMIAELAEVEIGTENLLRELKKTLKRVNALSHVYIPLYESTLKYMEETLEEREREALFQMKKVKKIKEGKS